MVALAGAGDYSAALAQYTVCRQTVADELRMAPEAETTALFQRLQAERQQLTGWDHGQQQMGGVGP